MVLLVSAGKDEFCKKVVEIVTPAYGTIISTVDFIKEVAHTHFNWDGSKTPKNRKFLSDLKDLLTDWNDIPFKKIKLQVDLFLSDLSYYGISKDDAAIFIMSREPEEIERLCKEFNAKSILVHNERAELEPASNHADTYIFNYSYDIEIDNNGSLQDLAYKALEFVEKEKLYFPHWKHLEIDFFGNLRYTK